LIKDVIAAKGSASKLHSILEPILGDANRLQHLDKMRNDILPWHDDAAEYPMVNAAWLLRTKNGFNDVGLRAYIDDDKAYWEEQRNLSN
jgi:hypothetical protein